MAKNVRIYTDEEIVCEFFARDGDAITHITEKYGGYIYSVCYSMLRQHEDSEEAQNEVYLRAWNSIPPNRPNDLRSFLSTLARRICVDHFRKGSCIKRGGGIASSLDDLHDILADDYSVTDEIMALELKGMIERFLSSLAEADRAVFIRRFYFSQTPQEISEFTGLNIEKVYRLLAQSKQKLKKILAKEGYLK